MDMKVRMIFLFGVLSSILERKGVHSSICPAVTCDSKQSDCAFHYRDNYASNYNILNSCNFRLNQECPINDDFLSQSKNETVSCRNITVNYNTRYPGEPCGNEYKCTDDRECVESTKLCFVKANETVACRHYFDCGVGKYCDEDDGKCKNLLDAYANCNTTSQCKNAYFCNFGKCIRYYSLDVKQKTQLREGCKYNRIYINSTDSEMYCDKISYNLQPNQTVTDGLIACKDPAKVECRYLGLYQNNVYGKCLCGYNPKGDYYCELEDTEQTAEYYTILANTMDNKCHKYRQSTCDLDLDGHDNTLLSNKKLLTTKNIDIMRRGQFYKADRCTRSIFGGEVDSSSSNFISLSAIVVAVLSIFIF